MDKVEWVCLTNTTGYAQSARDYIFALKDHYDFRVLSLDNKPDESVVFEKTYETINKLRHKPFQEDAVQVFHCIPDMQRRRRWIRNKCKKTVGFATFETHDPPKHWVHILNHNDAVIAPSQFCVDVFKEAGVETPIIRVPHIVNTDVYKTDVEEMLPSDQFTFLYIASFRDRKNYTELLKAWYSFFADKDDYRLVLKTDFGDMLRNLVIKTCQGHMPDNVVILDHTMHEKEIPMLIKSADCMIHPSLGEGFGLPPLFAMAMNVPVILPDHSGLVDYATEDNAFIMKSGDPVLPKATMDNYPQFRKCLWPTVDYLTIYKAMDTILRNADDMIEEKTEAAYECVTQNYSYSNARNHFEKLMELLRS
jgi:glycosyltransferase involved in cell wall biosynthesis